MANTKLGQFLKDAIKQRKMSQKQLADKCKLEPSLISKYINSPITPTYENIISLSDALNIPENELIENLDDNELKEKYYGKNFPMQKGISVCFNPQCPGLQLGLPKLEHLKVGGLIFDEKSKYGDKIDYCPYCGQKVINKCLICQKPILYEQGRFCYHCGALLYMACNECGPTLKFNKMRINKVPDSFTEFNVEEINKIIGSMTVYESITYLRNKDLVRREIYEIPVKYCSSMSTLTNDISQKVDKNVFFTLDVGWDDHPLITADCMNCGTPGEGEYIVSADFKMYAYDPDGEHSQRLR